MPDNRRTPPSRLGTAALVAGAVALGIAACDGSNAFGPVGVGPSIVSIETADQATSSGQMTVNARAVAAIRVDSIVMTVEGAFEARQVESNSGRSADVTFEFSFDVPEVITDTLAVITAWAVDAQGNVSAPKSRTVRVLDAFDPSVSMTVAPDTAAQGDPVSVTVSAMENVGLRRLGIEVRDPSGALVHADSVPASGTSGSHTFTWWIPETPTFGTHRVTGYARDVSGNRGESTSQIEVVFQDKVDPEVQILIPGAPGQSVQAGDSIRVQARVLENDQIQSIRFLAFAVTDDAAGVGDTILRYTPREVVYDESVPTTDVTVSRYLRFDFSSLARIAPAGSEEPLMVVVEATDRSGRVGADTVTMVLAHDVVAPQVQIISPADGTSYYVADTIPIPVSFSVGDNQGPVRTGVVAMTVEVKQLVAVAGGDIDDTALAPARSFSLQDAGALNPIVAPRTIEVVVPGLTRDTDAADRYFFVVVTARDAAGNIGADTLRLVSLGAPPEPEPDPAPPMSTPSTAAGAGGAAHLPEPRRLEDGS